MKTKMLYTYEPLTQIFEEMHKNFSTSVSSIFAIASENMKTNGADEAWKIAIDKSGLNISNEDKKILKTLGKMLGKTDIDGQVSQIEQMGIFVEMQIDKAEKEREKNENLYKKLGTVIGLALVIVLI